MDDLQTSDEVTFIPETVEPVCFDVIEAVLKDKTYNDMLVQGWIDEICSRITKELIETNKPFKYAGMFLLYHNRSCFKTTEFSDLISHKSNHFSSHLHNNAEEWCRVAYWLFLLLGLCQR